MIFNNNINVSTININNIRLRNCFEKVLKEFKEYENSIKSVKKVFLNSLST